MEEEAFFPQWENLKITEAEHAIVNLEDDEIEDLEKKLQNAVVCKILTSKMVNVEAFRSTMPRIWNFEGNMRIKNMDRNIYFCKFETPKDKKRVMENGPWFFDKALLVFEEPRENCKFTDLEFQYASFWIHFHNLPLACFSRTMATAFGDLVGKFEKVETDDDGWCWGRTMRVRIRVDVKRPLRRGVKVKVGSTAEVIWIPITYEKLPDFCYGCGKLGNILKDCDSHSETAEEDLQYGDWLRGVRRKMCSRREEEDEKFRGKGPKGEGWEEDSDGGDNPNSKASESEPDGRLGSPESRPDGEGRETGKEEEGSDRNGKEKTVEESVEGMISGENEEGGGEKWRIL